MPWERDSKLESSDWIVILAGFLGAVKIFLASLPEPYSIRIQDETISATINMIAFGIVLIGIVRGNWKNRKEVIVVEKEDENVYRDVVTGQYVSVDDEKK